jgi:hypothetical protein
MKKTYYFPHDFEAISDPKIQFIISQYGGVAYGIWWRIVEMLHQTENNKLPHKFYIYFAIGNQLKIDEKTVEDFINSCLLVELLQSDSVDFWSDRVLKNVGKMADIKNKRSEAGKKSAENRSNNQTVATSVQQNLTSVEQMLTSVQQNPTKENKRNNNIYIPEVKDVVDYFIENGYSGEIGRKAFLYYESGNWSDGNGNKVKNWKQKMRGVWFKDENKIKNINNFTNFGLPTN